MPAKPKKPSVVLTPAADRFVQGKVKSGEFRSAGDVIQEGLRIMRAHEEAKEAARAEFDEMIRHGYEQAKRGETVDPFTRPRFDRTDQPLWHGPLVLLQPRSARRWASWTTVGLVMPMRGREIPTPEKGPPLPADSRSSPGRA